MRCLGSRTGRAGRRQSMRCPPKDCPCGGCSMPVEGARRRDGRGPARVHGPIVFNPVFLGSPVIRPAARLVGMVHWVAPGFLGARGEVRLHDVPLRHAAPSPTRRRSLRQRTVLSRPTRPIRRTSAGGRTSCPGSSPGCSATATGDGGSRLSSPWGCRPATPK